MSLTQNRSYHLYKRITTDFLHKILNCCHKDFKYSRIFREANPHSYSTSSLSILQSHLDLPCRSARDKKRHYLDRHSLSSRVGDGSPHLTYRELGKAESRELLALLLRLPILLQLCVQRYKSLTHSKATLTFKNVRERRCPLVFLRQVTLIYKLSPKPEKFQVTHNMTMNFINSDNDSI